MSEERHVGLQRGECPTRHPLRLSNRPSATDAQVLAAREPAADRYTDGWLWCATRGAGMAVKEVCAPHLVPGPRGYKRISRSPLRFEPPLPRQAYFKRNPYRLAPCFVFLLSSVKSQALVRASGKRRFPWGSGGDGVGRLDVRRHPRCQFLF